MQPQTMYSTQDFYSAQMRQQVYDRKLTSVFLVLYSLVKDFFHLKIARTLQTGSRYDDYQAQYEDQYVIPQYAAPPATNALQYVYPSVQDLYSQTTPKYASIARSHQSVDPTLERILKENKEAWEAYTSGKFNVETELVDGIKKIILKEKGKIKGKRRGTETKDDYNIKVIAQIETVNANKSDDEALLKRSTSSMTIKPLESIEAPIRRSKSEVTLDAMARRGSYVPSPYITPYDYQMQSYYQPQYVDPTFAYQDPTMYYYQAQQQQQQPVQVHKERKSRKNGHKSRKDEIVKEVTTDDVTKVQQASEEAVEATTPKVADLVEKKTKHKSSKLHQQLSKQNDIYHTVNSYYGNQFNMYQPQHSAQFFPSQPQPPQFATPYIDPYQATAQFYPQFHYPAPQIYPHDASLNYKKIHKYRHQKSTKKFADVSLELEKAEQKQEINNGEVKALEDKKQTQNEEQIEVVENNNNNQQTTQQQTNEEDKSAFAEYTQEETKKLIRTEKISTKQLEEQFRIEEAKYGFHGRIPIVRLANLFAKLKLSIPVEEFNPAAAFVGGKPS